MLQNHEIHDGAMLSSFLQKTPFSVKEKRFLGWGREEPICQPKHMNGRNRGITEGMFRKFFFSNQVGIKP